MTLARFRFNRRPDSSAAPRETYLLEGSASPGPLQAQISGRRQVRPGFADFDFLPLERTRRRLSSLVAVPATCWNLVDVLEVPLKPFLSFPGLPNRFLGGRRAVSSGTPSPEQSLERLQLFVRPLRRATASSSQSFKASVSAAAICCCISASRARWGSLLRSRARQVLN